MVGPEKDWIKYAYDGDVVITAEPDGVRIITEDIQEFIQRVPGEGYTWAWGGCMEVQGRHGGIGQTGGMGLTWEHWAGVA